MKESLIIMKHSKEEQKKLTNHDRNFANVCLRCVLYQEQGGTIK